MHAIEQQIYASLAIPGLKAGHHTHATTPGLASTAAERHEQICNRWGEYEPGVDFTRAVIHIPLWLDSDPPADPSHYATILVTYQGRDAGGRPGAMLRHIVRIPAERFQGLDYHPFHLVRGGKMLESWTPDTPFPVLEPLSDPTRADDLRAIFPERYALLRGLLGSLLAQQRMHLPADQDSPAAEETLAQLLELVPLSVRKHLSVASYSQRNTKDYHVAVVRQEGLSFRASLAAVATVEDPKLNDAARTYIQQLFTALEAKNWDGALRLIHSADLPWEQPVLSPSTQTMARQPEPVADDGPRHEPPPEMPYRRREAAPRKSRMPLFLGLGAGLLLILTVVILAGRGQKDEIGAPSDFASFSSVRGDDLSSLLANYESSASGLIVGGASDFDLEQSMHGAKRALGTNWEGAWAGELRRIDTETQAAARAGGLSGAALATALGAAADRIEDQGQRLAGFHATVAAGSAAPLRAAYDETARVLQLPRAQTDPADPGIAAALQYAALLRDAAQILNRAEQTGSKRDASAWSALASEFEPLGEGASAPSPLPAVVREAAALAAAMADLLPAEQGLAARASTLPYAAGLQDGPLGDAATRLLAAVDPPAMKDVRLPLAAQQAVAFHRTWRATVSPGLRGDATDALAAIAALCAGENSACSVAGYEAHVRRWTIELWRKIQDPTAATAAAVVKEYGEAVLPVGGAAQIRPMVALLEEMQRTALPAPPDVATRIEAGARNLADPVARSVVEGWLARNRRGSQGEQTRFTDLYARAKTAQQQFSKASNADAPGRFRALRSSVDEIAKVDLAQVSGPEVAAVSALRTALAASADVRFSEVAVHLLRQVDYSGATRPVATLELTVSRDGQKAPGLVLGFPPMLWAPVVGFETARQAVPAPIGMHPEDKLLIVGRDKQSGQVWFHLRVAPGPDGHVAATLAGEHLVRIDAAAAAQASSSGSFPESTNRGDEVAKVTFVLQDGWWSRFASGLPQLP